MSSQCTVAEGAFDEHIAKFSNRGPCGQDDQIGTANYITRAHVCAAAGLNRTGQVTSLALRFDQRGPQTGANGRFNCLRYSLVTGSHYSLEPSTILRCTDSPTHGLRR